MEGGWEEEEEGKVTPQTKKGVWIMQTKQHPFSPPSWFGGFELQRVNLGSTRGTRREGTRPDFLPVIILRLFMSAA